MSANLIALAEPGREVRGELASEKLSPVVCDADWSAEKFAREQVRGLVRQLFSPRTAAAVRQVVFSAVGDEIDIDDLCLRVGQRLAAEKMGDVAVVARPIELRNGPEGLPLKQIATQMCRNLWLLPGGEDGGECLGFDSRPAFQGSIRSQFDYSIIAAATPAELDAVVQAAQSSDGIVLVLRARRTRRVTALRVKHALEQAQARILGTVLMDREFPIPESLYRRL